MAVFNQDLKPLVLEHVDVVNEDVVLGGIGAQHESIVDASWIVLKDRALSYLELVGLDGSRGQRRLKRERGIRLQDCQLLGSGIVVEQVEVNADSKEGSCGD